MSVVLICPSRRAGFEPLSRGMPLVAVPLAGQSLLEYWLSHLSSTGAGRVLVLAHDRPDVVRQITGDGGRWGLEVEVIDESRELEPAQAFLKYSDELPGLEQSDVLVLDAFPESTGTPLFSSYTALYSGLLSWLPRAWTSDRVGVRELRPSVWVNPSARVSSTSHLAGPCWIGRNVILSANSVVGAGTFLEEGTIVQQGAEVISTYVAPYTLIGPHTRLINSIAVGSSLANWRSGSVVDVADQFVLSELRRPLHGFAGSWLRRAAGVCSRKEEFQMFWKHLLMNKEG